MFCGKINLRWNDNLVFFKSKVRVGLYFGMRYFMSHLVLQSPWRGRASWMLCFIIYRMSCYCKYPVALPLGAIGLICSLCLWYFLIIFTFYLNFCTSIGIHKKPPPRLWTHLYVHVYLNRQDQFSPSIDSSDTWSDIVVKQVWYLCVLNWS